MHVAQLSHLDASTLAPTLNVAGARLARVNASLWRVCDRSGLVRGHLEAVRDPLGVRYRARRFRAAAGVFLELGDFWSADDAVSALFSR